MFLRPNYRSKDGKDHTYWSLVETVGTPDGPRQKTLCYLGELNSSAQARWLTTVEGFNEQGDAQQLKLFPSHVARKRLVNRSSLVAAEAAYLRGVGNQAGVLEQANS